MKCKAACYGFLESLENFKKLSQKNPFSGSFLEVFQLRRLLRPIFWQMTGLIKIHNRVEFYEYSILDCQVINFQNFSYQFNIHEMPLFGEVVSPNSPKYCQILLKFSLQLVFKEKNSALITFEKLKFLQKREIPSVYTFGPTWAPFFPLKKMAKLKEIMIILEEKIHLLGFPKIVKSRRISSPLQMKNRITFCPF